jgi:hypothetical protein
MASSFITKDNIHGFWVNDSLMQVVCWGLVNVIDTTPSNDKNYWLKKEHREHIYDNSQGIFIGFMNLRLDDFLINQERKNIFKEIIFEAKKYFLHKGEYISAKDLNDFQLISESKREWLSPLETKRIIKILSYLNDVVNDKIIIKDSDEIDYEF